MKRTFAHDRVSPDKDDRMPIVAHLYQVGLKPENIAYLLSISQGTVCKDLDDLGGFASFKSRPTRENDIFKTVFHDYAWLLRERIGGRWNSHLEAIELCLSIWLGIDQVLLTLKALGDVLLQIVPNKKENQGYVDLLMRIFPEIQITSAKTSVHFWNEYLRMIVDKQVEVPGSYDELTSHLAFLASLDWRQYIPPAWTDRTSEIIKKWLDLLNRRSQLIIAMYFGLDEMPCSMAVIGQKFGGVTAQRISQTILKALEDLRRQIDPREVQLFLHPSYLVAPLFELSVSQNLQRVLDLEVRHLQLKATIVKRLTESGILKVNQLIEKSAEELMEIPRIGRFSVHKIKKALAIHGYSLAEKTSEQSRKSFNNTRQKVAQQKNKSRLVGLKPYLARKLKRNNIAEIGQIASMSIPKLRELSFSTYDIGILREYLTKHGLQFTS